MSGRSKAFTEKVKEESLSLVAASGVNLLEDNVIVLPLAKQLMERTGCGVDTAKVKIAWAARRLRCMAIHGEAPAEAPPKQGGARPGSGFPTGVKRNGRRGKAKEEKES